MITFIQLLKNFWRTNNWRKDFNFLIQFGTSLTFLMCMVLSRPTEFSEEWLFSRLGLFQQQTVENLLLKYLYRCNPHTHFIWAKCLSVNRSISYPSRVWHHAVQSCLASNVLCKVHCSLANALQRIWIELAEDVSLVLLIAHMQLLILR